MFQQRKMTYDKQRVLERLRTNRESHTTKVAAAWEGYRNRVKELLEEQLDLLKNNSPEFDNYAIARLPVPVDKTDEYDTIIAMLELANDTTIELDQEEVAHWLLDKWDWSKQFVGTNSAYAPESYRD